MRGYSWIVVPLIAAFVAVFVAAAVEPASAADLKMNAARVLEQVEDRTMPLGNETDMTDDEREALARWVRALQ